MIRVQLIDRNGASVDIRTDDEPTSANLAEVCGRAAALAEARKLATGGRDMTTREGTRAGR